MTTSTKLKLAPSKIKGKEGVMKNTTSCYMRTFVPFTIKR